MNEPAVTDDLVQRLRHDARTLGVMYAAGLLVREVDQQRLRRSAKDVHEAADALERLQADNQRWKAERAKRMAVEKSLHAERAEVVRLQQALRDHRRAEYHLRYPDDPVPMSVNGDDPYVDIGLPHDRALWAVLDTNQETQ